MVRSEGFALTRFEGDRARAEGAWGRVAELLPDDAEAQLALGQIYVERQMSLPAYVALMRVTNLDATDAQKRTATEKLGPLRGKGYTSDDGRGLAARAEKYFGNDNWPDAIQQYQAALALSPYLAGARTKLIRALIAQSRETKSAETARQAEAETARELKQRTIRNAAFTVDN